MFFFQLKNLVFIISLCCKDILTVSLSPQNKIIYIYKMKYLNVADAIGIQPQETTKSLDQSSKCSIKNNKTPMGHIAHLRTSSYQ